MFVSRTNIQPTKLILTSLLILVLIVGLVSVFLANRSSLDTRSGATRRTLPSKSLYPYEDAYVDEDKPGDNFGTSQSLTVDGSPVRYAYLKFDLSGISTTALQSIKLQLYVTDGTKNAINIKIANPNDWSEGTVTYKTRPTRLSTTIAQFNPATTGVDMQVDISKAFLGVVNQQLSLAIEPTSSYKFAAGSRESDHKPMLVIQSDTEPTVLPTTTTKPSPTPTVKPTATLVPSSTVKPSQTSIPSPTKTPTPTVIPTTTPITGARKGVWTSAEEIMKLPMSGTTWNDMVKVANSDIGAANMSDQNSAHPEKLVGLALVAVRTQSETLKTKALNELVEAIGTENNPDPYCASPTLGARGLAVGRNLIGYAVAADILNVRTGGYDPSGKGTQVQKWIDYMRHRKNCDSNGKAQLSGDISEGHDSSTSNGNALSGASRIAAAAYLGDKAELDKAWLTFRHYAGDTTVGPTFDPNSFSGNWKVSETNYVGINPKGAHCSGTSSAFLADGVLPNDQGRGGNCPTSVSAKPGYTQYPWEGLQGAYAQALMLDRLGYKDPLGKTPWHVSDDALKRAVEYQWYLQTNYPVSDGVWYDRTRAAWVKHLAFKMYGFKPMEYAASGGGRNIDWTQWTVQ